MSNLPFPKRLDLSARSLDLLSVITKSSDSLADVARDIISWRGREGLSEDQLTFALDAAKDFARPNANGEVISANLEKTASRLYGLQMVMPGAIGRAILADPRLSWLATTQAVLLKYHDLYYSSRALCNLTLTSIVAQDDHRRSAYFARMYPVISKLVESIAIHSTNPGYGVSDLPEALRELPQHFQDAGDFADSVHAIQGADQQQLLVQTEYCVTGLLDWIFNHWQGFVMVSVSNEVLYQAQLGKQTNRLFFIINSICPAEVNCFDPNHLGKVQIAIAVDASTTLETTQTLYTGRTDPLHGRSPCSYRSKLYDIHSSGKDELTELTKKEQVYAKKNAQEILRSIVNLKVLPFRHTSIRLGFKIQTDAGQLLRWWLPKVPGLLQGNYGSTVPPRQLWTERSLAMSQLSTEVEQETASIESRHQDHGQPIAVGAGYSYKFSSKGTLKLLRKAYPEVEEVVRMVKSRCACGCEKLLEDFGEHGCLQTAAATYLLLHVGHGLVDAAGLQSVSNLQDSRSERSLCEATINILTGIAKHGEIHWRTWFKMAASAATGIPHDVVDDYASADDAGDLVAWVCGSMTVVPLWFQLGHEIEIQHSWGVQVLDGKLSTLEPDIAVIESQLTNGTKPMPIPRQPEMQSVVQGDLIDTEVPLEAFSSIISGTRALYRLLTLISSPSSVRVLDPADVYKGHMAATRPCCSHKSQPQEAVLWSIDEVLQGWLGHRPKEVPKFDLGVPVYLTDNLGLKLNVAVGLCYGQCVLHSEDSCFKCLITAARECRGWIVSGKGGQAFERLQLQAS